MNSSPPRPSLHDSYGIISSTEAFVMADRTIFEKIWDGDIPSHTIYRNDKYGLLAMLDIFPATRGHTLVVPREPVDQWTELSEFRLTQATILGKLVALQMQEALSPLRITRHTIGFGVPHIHDQYVPSYVRGDTAYLYDPRRMEQPEAIEELRTLQEELRFPEELAEMADARMAQLAEMFDI